MSIRYSAVLNLAQYAVPNHPIRVGKVMTLAPKQEQMILRMLVEAPYADGLQLPDELEWLRPHIETARQFQAEHVGVKHPFTYVTVRHGMVATETDDLWHVDGFSMKYHHLPEANYVFASGGTPTEIAVKPIAFPDNFDPLKHNIHLYLAHRMNDAERFHLQADCLYLMDPYVIHRRPPGTQNAKRTFARISFTPIEIPDINNTKNPLIPTPHYTVDGVKGFRDQLLDYDEQVAA